MANTPNFALPYPALSDSPDVPRDMQALAVATDTAMNGLDTQGTKLARPAASTGVGIYYYATDEKLLYRSDGANWNLVTAGATQQWKPVPGSYASWKSANVVLNAGASNDLDVNRAVGTFAAIDWFLFTLELDTLAMSGLKLWVRLVADYWANQNHNGAVMTCQLWRQNGVSGTGSLSLSQIQLGSSGDRLDVAVPASQFTTAYKVMDPVGSWTGGLTKPQFGWTLKTGTTFAASTYMRGAFRMEYCNAALGVTPT